MFQDDHSQGHGLLIHLIYLLYKRPPRVNRLRPWPIVYICLLERVLLNTKDQVETVYSFPSIDRWTNRNHKPISDLTPSALCELLLGQLVRTAANNRLRAVDKLA
jgi:hypothetical protein